MPRMYLRPAMSAVVLLYLSLLAQGISGQLTGVTGGLDSDACVNEMRSMEEIVSGGRSETEGFFAGGLHGEGAYKRYGCWRQHACLDALNAAGVDTTGDAICYKFNSAQRSWLLWGLQSSLDLQCSSGRDPAPSLSSTTSSSSSSSHSSSSSSSHSSSSSSSHSSSSSSSSHSSSSSSSNGASDMEQQSGLLGFPLTAPWSSAPRVDYLSNYSFPLSPLRRTLTPVAGYDAGDSIFTPMPLSNSSWNQPMWHSGCLLPNGKIVFVPYSKLHIGIFDPADGNMNVLDISDQVSAANYQGGVLAPNGMVYFVPASSPGVGKFNPSDNTFSNIDIADTSDWGYHGGVLANNNKIYFVPHNADNVGVFDPSDDSFETVRISVGQDWKYAGGVLAPNGKIVFVPWSTTSVGVFDPSDNSFNTYPFSMSYTHHYEKFIGGVLTPDGKVVFVPRGASNIGIFDPSDNTFSVVAEPGITYTSMPSFGKYGAGVLAPNGQVIFVPYKGSNDGAIGIFDPSTKSFTTIGISDKMDSEHIWNNAGYWGGVVAKNGKIVFVPMNANSVGILDLGNQDLGYSVSGAINEGWNAVLSPHFNKY